MSDRNDSGQFQPGNKVGQKHDEPAESWLQVRVPRRMKAGWVRAAQGRPLSEWVTDTLERAAARELRR